MAMNSLTAKAMSLLFVAARDRWVCLFAYLIRCSDSLSHFIIAERAVPLAGVETKPGA